MPYRSIRLAPDAKHLFIASEYNDEIRLAIKSLSGAVWNRDLRVWVVPIEHRDAIVGRLERFHFEIDDDIKALPPTQVPKEKEATFSLSELNYEIRSALSRRFLGPVWVRGELASFDKTARRRHLYFELVEKPKGSEQVVARLSAVVFQRQREAILARLTEAGESIELRDGLEVRLRGRIDYYPPSGRVQLIVEDINPQFSLGQLALMRMEILETLSREGILTRNLELPWPPLAQRIGLITAPDSDAYHDFVRTLTASPYGFEVIHCPVAVQGPQLEGQVLAALDYLERRSTSVDVVVLIRGGGARSDLAWFDNLKVARRIARYSTKLLVGIGHQRDRSVLDEIAASEKTPTAAAEHLIPRIAQTEEHLNTVVRRLAEQVRNRVGLEIQRERLYRMRLSSGARTVHSRAFHRLEEQLVPRLRSSANGQLAIESMRFGNLARRLSPEQILRSFDALKSHQSSLRSRFRTIATTGMTGAQSTLKSLKARIASVDPKRTLARGFSIVYNAEGKVVHRPADAPVGTSIAVRLHEGQLDARVVRDRLDEE